MTGETGVVVVVTPTVALPPLLAMVTPWFAAVTISVFEEGEALIAALAM